MTPEEYLLILAGFESQLRRRADPWGNPDLTPLAQELRRAWESTAAAFRAEHPDAEIPAPFWARLSENGTAEETSGAGT